MIPGIDLVEIDRIKKLVSRHKDKALHRIWTPSELDYARKRDGSYRIKSLAAAYAGKEAVAKALGTGFGPEGVGPAEIEILHKESGRPYVVLHGKVLNYFESRGLTRIEISLTHTKDTAAAVCIIS